MWFRLRISIEFSCVVSFPPVCGWGRQGHIKSRCFDVHWPLRLKNEYDKARWVHPRLRTRRLPRLELPIYLRCINALLDFWIFFIRNFSSLQLIRLRRQTNYWHLQKMSYNTFSWLYKMLPSPWLHFCSCMKHSADDIMKMLFFTFGQSQSPIIWIQENTKILYLLIHWK